MKKKRTDLPAKLHEEGTNMKKWILTQWLTSCFKDGFDLTNSRHRKTEISYSITVMDRVRCWIDGNEERSQIGTRCAASIWMHTMVVIYHEQKHMETFRNNKMNSIMEAASWVCAYFVRPP